MRFGYVWVQVISSSLIRPLVAPLVARRGSASARQMTGLSKSRLAATALALSALVAVTAPDDAEAARQAEAAKVVRTAHKKPTRSYAKPIWHLDLVAVLTGRVELEAPQASPDFDNEALASSRYRDGLDPGLPTGPGLNRGRRMDRLLGASDLAFLNFGSARILAAQPHS